MNIKLYTSARKIFILFSFFFALLANAQAPEKMSYQAVIRNNSNVLVANQGVGMKISILQGTATGTEVYKELFNPNPTTNANGLVTIAIGTGLPITGTFAGIDWSEGPYFIKTETDPTGGTNYTITATTQLMSVPYALYAKTAGSSNAWGLSGNAGTTSTNFIGTTDDKDLQLKVNNQKAGVIESDDNTENTIKNANTAFGYQSLNSNTTGYYNTAFGYQSLYSNTTGIHNTAIGQNTLFSNTEGHFNEAIGQKCLYSNTTGSRNSANGYKALYSNTTGNNNLANGYHALYSNTTGYANVANGNQSLYSNTTGSRNLANGFQALYFNTTGFDNLANGYQSLYSNTTGYANVANGNGSLYFNTTGDFNVANGYHSLNSNTTGSDNVANGGSALQSNTTGSDNVANGSSALYSNTTAAKNTAVGKEALYTIITGSNNTAIGYQAGNGLNGDRFNTTCLGYTTGWNTTNNNSVNIGNFSVGWIGGQVAWGNYSDKRIKNNIKENVPGLAFISKLKPVTYNLDIHKQYEIATKGLKDTTADYPGKYDIEKVTQTGFLAQDVEAAAKSIGYDFSGVEAPKDGEGLYKLRYSEFVVPMVKAIQEQQEIIETQNQKIEKLEALVNQLINKK